MATVVIPPGYEDLFAQVFGRGETLPGECRFSGGEAAGPTVRATYACGFGEIVLALAHPSQAPKGATLTKQFAISVQSGSAPAGLVDAVAARLRAREGEIQWKWLGPPPSGSWWPAIRVISAMAAIVIVAIAFVRLIRRRRSSAGSRQPS
jgi:hypothetical protein